MYVGREVRLEPVLVLEALAADEAGELWFFAADPLVRVHGGPAPITAAAVLAGERGG